MSFVSYAQNFEDVMLWRALKHVDKGFYIDIGANDPTVDSVTKAFYERGWHGINVEPLPSHHSDLAVERMRDVNLQCAAGAEAGEIEVWECDVRGWATASLDVVSLHTGKGHEGVFHKVPVFPLKDICAQHVSGEVHFLKIDVEGFEKSVIDGMDFSHVRPWILVIEATKPNSTEENYSEWEAIVFSAGFALAYTDGLNRFYVANEHLELLESFRYPPNVFDKFVRVEQLNSELRAQQAEVASVESLAKLQAVYASSSWKITRPLRGVESLLAGDFVDLGRTVTAARIKVKQLLRPTVAAAISYVNARPILRNRIKWLVSNFPSLRQRLVRVALSSHGNSLESLVRQRERPFEQQNMTHRARQIFKDLKTAIDNKNEGVA